MLSARTARERRDSAARAGVRAGRKDWHRKIGSTSRERFGPFWVNGLPEWSGTRPLASGSARNDRRTAPIVIWATTPGASDMVFEAIRSSRSHHRAGHPARLATRLHVQAFGRFAQLLSTGGEETAEQTAARSFSSRPRQLSALLPSRSRIPASSAEIAVFPLR